ncbi:MAG TPA: AbrB/MazE/SpoVT family DNA-binding domain-containing protein [Acetobacteraceae bacterium]
MSEIKRVQLVRTGPVQTVEIPPEFAMPGDAVLMHREGERLIIEPIKKLGLLEWLATLDPIEEEFPDVDEGMLPLRDINL